MARNMSCCHGFVLFMMSFAIFVHVNELYASATALNTEDHDHHDLIIDKKNHTRKVLPKKHVLSPIKIEYDNRALKVNGKRRLILSGAIHYPRSTPQVSTF